VGQFFEVIEQVNQLDPLHRSSDTER
jgi:hypothetical protein